MSLKDDDPLTVSRMLNYLYTLDYDDSGLPASPDFYMSNESPSTQIGDLVKTLESGATTQHHMMNNSVVYAIAAKYDIPDLKVLAENKFAQHALKLWSKDLTSSDRPFVDAVVMTTPSSDLRLRTVVACMCTPKPGQDSNIEPDLGPILEDHGMLGLMMRQRKLRESAVLRGKLMTIKEQLGEILKLAELIPNYETTYRRLSSLKEEIKAAAAALQVGSQGFPDRFRMFCQADAPKTKNLLGEASNVVLRWKRNCSGLANDQSI